MQITVGLDFGTHQTKICVETIDGAETSYEFIKFKDANGKEHFTLPSVISIGNDGCLKYGYLPEKHIGILEKISAKLHVTSHNNDNENVIIRYFKQTTFTDSVDDAKKDEAILFTIWYLANIFFDLDDRYGQSYSIQMGVPTDSEHAKEQNILAVRIIFSALRLVEDVFHNNKEEFLKASIEKLKDLTVFVDYVKDDGILVFPEAYACLMPLVSSGKIPGGMSLMVDIGGGTTDISFFALTEGEPPLVYCFSSIDKGLNFLTDADSHNNQRKDSNVINSSEIYPDRKDQYIESIEKFCGNVVNTLYKEISQKKNSLKYALRRAIDPRPIIYTGGGSTFDILCHPSYGFKEIINISDKEWKKENIKDFKLIKELKLCPILSTAYGLSIHAENDDIKRKSLEEIFDHLMDKKKKHDINEGGMAYDRQWYEDMDD